MTWVEKDQTSQASAICMMMAETTFQRYTMLDGGVVLVVSE